MKGRSKLGLVFNVLSAVFLACIVWVACTKEDNSEVVEHNSDFVLESRAGISADSSRIAYAHAPDSCDFVALGRSWGTVRFVVPWKCGMVYYRIDQRREFYNCLNNNPIGWIGYIDTVGAWNVGDTVVFGFNHNF